MMPAVPINSPAPWVDDFLALRLGWDEVSKNDVLKKCWSFTDDCRELTSVIGNTNAWCAAELCEALETTGFTSPRSGAAVNFSRWGMPVTYVYGAVLSLRHPDGSHHATCFLGWIDFPNRIAACIGGNQGNKIQISAFNLSGNLKGHNDVISGPRWPSGWPVGPKTGLMTGWPVGSTGPSTR
jgi:hypothetical protein